MLHTYRIDSSDVTVRVRPNASFASGEDVVLADRFDDLTRGTDWFDDGYCVTSTAKLFDAKNVKHEISNRVAEVINEEHADIDLTGFSLERYHHFVNDDQHGQVIARTRRFFPPDFGFDSERIVCGIGDLLGCKLSYTNPVSQSEQWIIVRINRPNSKGYNPVHKDIYEPLDTFGAVPRMINAWIPICGVNGDAGLPVAPGSHLVPESKIKRTKNGSVLNDQKYSVNSILSWDGGSKLKSIAPSANEMLLFSSHLIHGLGRNNNPDLTRVSLEFRLYEV